MRVTPIIFVHIPKTGGVSLERVLLRGFRPGEVFALGNASTAHAGGHRHAVATFRQLSASTRREIGLLFGHMAYGLHRLMPGTCRYITLVRSPIERVVSFYNYARIVGRHPTATPAARAMSLREFVESEAHPFVVNGQTRILAGDRSWRQWSDDFGDDVAADDLLPRALAHLEQIDLIGLTERYADTLLLLRAAFGWTQTISAPDNVTPADDRHPQVHVNDLDAATYQAICDRNELDLQLYERAVRLFERRRHDLGLHAPATLDGSVDANELELTLVAARLARANPALGDAERRLTAHVYLELFRLVWPGGPAITPDVVAERIRLRTGSTVDDTAVDVALSRLLALGWVESRFVAASPTATSALRCSG
jgi:hypothetical protein